MMLRSAAKCTMASGFLSSANKELTSAASQMSPWAKRSRIGRDGLGEVAGVGQLVEVDDTVDSSDGDNEGGCENHRRRN